MHPAFKKTLYVMSGVLLLFFVLTLLIPFINFTFTETDVSFLNNKKIKVIAHRGASGHAPENTLVSFSKAIELGADMVELDVHLTSDDSVVVMHDQDVDRTTDGKGQIYGMKFSEIRELDAGSWFGAEYKGEKVPTLAEVIQLVNGRAKILIELKWASSGLYNGLVEKSLQVIRDNRAESWVILQSFETAYLSEAAKLAPDIEQHQLIFGKSGLIPFYFDRFPKFGTFSAQKEATSVNIHYLYVNEKLIRDMHRQNKTVFAFTPNKDQDIKKLINLGIDGIITNFPDKALSIIDKGFQ